MLNTAHRTNIVLDENIVQEALKISKIKTRRTLIDTALREFVISHKKPNIFNKLLAELDGESPFYDDYDYKAMRGRDLPKLK